MSRAHDVWNGAAAGDTADMRGVDIPRFQPLIWWIDGRTGAGLPLGAAYRRFESYPIHLLNKKPRATSMPRDNIKLTVLAKREEAPFAYGHRHPRSRWMKE